MYKIDDEFRPPGRVFMKATRETNGPDVPVRKSSLKKAVVPASSGAITPKGPPITTNLDNRAIQFQHEVSHEQTIEAMITEYPPQTNGTNGGVGSDLQLAIPSSIQHNNKEQITQLQAITKNIRTSSDILGQSFETVKTSQRQPDGNRRITTHIVRKITTVSRAEETQDAQDLIREARKTQTTEYGVFETTNAIEPKRAKVLIICKSKYYNRANIHTLILPYMRLFIINQLNIIVVVIYILGNNKSRYFILYFQFYFIIWILLKEAVIIL